MVVGFINGHSGSAEALRGIDFGHTRVQDLYPGQEVRVERRIKDFKLEEGVVVTVGPKAAAFIYKPSEQHEKGGSLPEVVVHVDEINDGTIRAKALVDSFSRTDEEMFIPVGTDRQVAYAESYNCNASEVINSAGEEGLLTYIASVTQEAEMVAVA